MLQKPIWKKTVAMLLCALVIFTTLVIRMDAAMADDTSNSETVDYVLILDCTVKAVDADEEGVRKAAAKMFVDLLPVDNARVAVFKVGEPDKNVENGKADAAKSYKLRADDDHMANALYRMRCIYQIWDFDQPVSTISQRDKLKAMIDNAYVQTQGVYSDTHCAVYAAIDTLKYWHSNNACILLVAEEFTAFYNQHKVVNSYGNQVDSDHTMWDDVRNTLFDHSDWIMNWVDLGNGTEKNRRTIEELCNMHGGEVCYGFSISRLPEMIANIVSKYAGQSDDEGMTQTLDASGYATIQLPAFKIMLTEANIVVTGDGVEKVTVTDDKGSRIDKPKDDIWFSTNLDPQDRTHFLYSAVKMIRPSSDAWTVNVKGKAGTQVYVQTIQTLEPDIELSCNVRPGQNIGVGTTLKFTAAFEYNNEKLRCGDEAYNHYLADAQLYYIHSSDPHKEQPINNLRVENEQYVAEFTVQERGTYNFYFYVKSNDFRSRIRHANPIENITVENHAPKIIKSIQDIYDVPVGSHLDGVADIASCYMDEDNEPLTYYIECRKNNRKVEMELPIAPDGFLSIDVPTEAGDYEFIAYAQDQNGARSEDLTFVVHAVNKAPQLVQHSPIQVKMIAKAPKLLVSLGLLPKEECREYSIKLNDIFTDPEGLSLAYSMDDSKVINKDGEEILSVNLNQNEGVFSASPIRKGNAQVAIVATDSSNETATVEFQFAVRKAGSVLFARYWWFFVILALVIIVLLIAIMSKKVRGAWSVTVADNGKTYVGSTELLTTLPGMSKSTISLLSATIMILSVNGINWQPNIPDCVFLKGTILPGKCKVNVKTGGVIVKNEEGNQVSKHSFVMRAGQQFVFAYDGNISITVDFQ